MGELEDKISKLLSSPEGMEQILAVAKMLSAQGVLPSGDSAGQTGAPPAQGNPEGTVQAYSPLEGAAPAAGGGDLSGLLSSLTGGSGKGILKSLMDIDPQILGTVLSLFGDAAAPDSNSTALLMALRPYLKEERQPKVEKALAYARLLRMGIKYLPGLIGGKGDV
ncbi:hypothetical protein [Papillibacter cinnamivorans]|uniref:Uncharacterized protein n=1 Tax=Papillibacter cinnamivorans DSM 12816 TaxID=1122930 RepID=A0A1W1YKP8_9FIRM|nr:hypothetical protein [Papillibacter cinnamivorans]SMC36381.1 hypothetical protein SAMN02745168_0484 [Papillibacter cinnamivorans DSM 12816]